MMSALAQPRRGERRLFVKFHAWHVLELPFIARAFPGVPWIFVFREPRAVLESQTRNPGAEVVLGTIDPAYLGLDHAAGHRLPPPEYAARVVAALCDAALVHANVGTAAFVDYATLPESVFTELSGFFGVPADRAALDRMRDAARLDAKSPGSTFEPRAEERGFSGEIEARAEEWLDAPYAALRAHAAAPA
jgi:hypothetical protein